MEPKFFRLYFPGLISLVFLPVIGVSIYLYKVKVSARVGMDVVWWNDASIKSWNKYTKPKLKISDYKDFQVITLAGDKKDNAKALQQLALNCTELIKKNKAGSGVTVSLTDNAQYSDLVNVLDLGYSFKGKINFMPYHDKVYFVMPYYKTDEGSVIKATPLFICGNSYVFMRQDLAYQSTAQFITTVKSLWPTSIPFLLMIFFSFRARKRRNMGTC
ncbi:hypothetical protein [Mucilaginibacter sp.]|uniref:hypothetical protein n=1 Tax=Mucilaginibacter sp. TaxID=1882438 RepID=UPI0032659093